MRRHKLFWGSSYDRGLDVLLGMWPKILKEYPDAELHICYGWELYDIATHNNKERLAWKDAVSKLMEQKGIKHYGRVGKEDLALVRKQCGIWAYPTYFTEINCITALDAQKDGLVPVCTPLAALKETVKHGIFAEKEDFLPALLKIMGDKKEWKRLSNKCQKFSLKYTWDKIAAQWIEEFKTPATYNTKVTIYTPTIRDGWWNVMANNLACQEYTNFEWIIVDDSKEDRSEIAKKYAEIYDLDIRYMKGKKRKIKRTYSLCNANNTALEAAKGELFVFLQDFVLLHPTAIGDLVRESARHPNAFIAPVDAYYDMKIKPNKDNKEDWFDGDIDVIGKFNRGNVRMGNWGMRKSETVTDFEQNFGAVPTRILRDLGGYYEFFDEALGWDDTDIIHRGFLLGYELWIDENIKAVCLDHHSILGKDEGGTSVNRTRRMNDPRFYWLKHQIKNGNLPIERNQEIDDKIDLQYEIPEEITDKQATKWVRENVEKIAKGWL